MCTVIIWKEKFNRHTEPVIVAMLQFDQIMKIVEVLGMPPNHMLDEAPKTKKFFDRLPDGSYIIKKPRDGKKVRSAVCKLFGGKAAAAAFLLMSVPRFPVVLNLLKIFIIV